MNRVRVKICGVRSLEEARAAVDAGADALGFNFWHRSPRYVEPETAMEIAASLSPLVARIGVFVNEDAEPIAMLASRLRLSAVQLHGDETPEFCRKVGCVKVIKAVR